MSDVFLTGTQNPGTNQPGTNQPAAPQLPAIPNYDGTQQGLQNTVDSLVHAVNRLAGHQPGTNNTSQQSQPKQDNKNKNKARFSEVSRITQTVKIKNPDDATQFVMVKQITKLVMQDTVTKEQWVWTL